MINCTNISRRAVVSVEATRLNSRELERAQDISDLVAWCGNGVLTPNQLYAYLKPDYAEARPRAMALLLRTSVGRHYLATSSHVLSGAAVAAKHSQQSIEPEQAELGMSSGSETEWITSPPLFGMTEIAFDEVAVSSSHRRGWFPAASFPHLNLSVIRLDETGPEIRIALERAGFVFVGADCIANEPSREGVDIMVMTSHSPTVDPRGELVEHQTRRGRVTGLSRPLSFFWTDFELPPQMHGAPVVERDTIVGFIAPQQVNFSSTLPSPFATVIKAGRIKELLAAHEAN